MTRRKHILAILALAATLLVFGAAPAWGADANQPEADEHAAADTVMAGTADLQQDGSTVGDALQTVTESRDVINRVRRGVQALMQAQAYSGNSIRVEAVSYEYSNASSAVPLAGSSLTYNSEDYNYYMATTDKYNGLYKWYINNCSTVRNMSSSSDYRLVGAFIGNLQIVALQYSKGYWEYASTDDPNTWHELNVASPVVRYSFQKCTIPVVSKTTSKGNLSTATTVYSGTYKIDYDVDITNVPRGEWASINLNDYEYYLAVIGNDRNVDKLYYDGTYSVVGSSTRKAIPVGATITFFYNRNGSGTSEDNGGTGGGGGGATTDKPIKVTDGAGNVLYQNNGQAALYDELDDAFKAVTNASLYTTAAHTTAYTGADYQVMMLTDRYTLNTPVTHASGNRNVTLTTEGSSPADGNYAGPGSCTITKADTAATSGKSMIQCDYPSFTVDNIKFDGANVPGARGAIIQLRSTNQTLAIGGNAQFWNGVSTAQAGAVYVSAGSTLTVGRGAWFEGNASSGDGGAIASAENTTVRLTGVTFNKNKAGSNGNGGALCLFNTSKGTQAVTVELTDCTFGDNSAESDGGAIRTSDWCNVTLTNNWFIRNVSGGEGGAIVVKSTPTYPSTLVIDGGSYQLNKASNGKSGGAARIGGYGTMTVKGNATFGGGSLYGNSAPNGGAIAVAPAATLNFESGTISYNTAMAEEGVGAEGNPVVVGGNGGGIYTESWGANLNITGGTISHNSAKSYTLESGATNGGNGGGIYAWGSANNITGVTISNCTADSQGGGIFTWGNILNITDEGGPVLIESCESDNLGGGIFALGDMNVKGSDVTINACKAPISGGAVCMSDGGMHATFADCTISNCSSTEQSAGGIFAWASSVVMENCTMTGNSAEWSGGCLCAANPDGTYVVKDCTMTGNRASSGSAVWVCNGGSVTVDGGVIRDNYAWAGAIYLNNVASKVNFQNDVYLYDNHWEEWTGAPQRNVYLNADTNGNINTTDVGLGSGAKIGVYVINERFDAHGGVNDPFGTFASSANLDKFVNDRNNLPGGEGYSNNQIVWRQPVKVEVRYVPSIDFDNVPTSYTVLYSDAAYNFTGNEPMSIEDIAAELRGKGSGGTGTMEFWRGYSYDPAGTSLLYNSYNNDLKYLSPFGITTDPNTPPGTWGLVSNYNTAATKNVQAGTENTLVVYFTEPVYFTIRNATDSNMDYYDTGALGSSGSFWQDTQIVTSSGVVPFDKALLNLSAGTDVTLKVLGGAGLPYSFGGGFSDPPDYINVTENGEFKMILERGNNPNVWNYAPMTGTLTSVPGGTTTLVFGDGATGSRHVIIRKADGNDYDSLAGATFRLMSASHITIADGLTSGPSGVFYIGDLHVGTYYLVEDVSPSGYEPAGYASGTRAWYQVTVTESAVIISEPQTGDVSGWGGSSGGGTGGGTGGGSGGVPAEELGAPKVGEGCTAAQARITAANWGADSFTWRQGDGYVYGECGDGHIAAVYVGGTYYLPYAHYAWTDDVPLSRVSPTYFFADEGFHISDLTDGDIHTYQADANDWNYAKVSWKAYVE